MSVSSMTGFGSGEAKAGGETVAVEVKSVNGKFCEVRPRLPRELAALESDAVRLVKGRVARGNVDVTVRRSAPGAGAQPRVNPEAFAVLWASAHVAARAAGVEGTLTAASLLAVPGVVVVEESSPDLEAARTALEAALGKALDGLVETRRREGAALAADLASHAATMRRLVAEVAQFVPASVAHYRDRLRARAQELAPDLSLDPARLEQEVVLFADRSDVAEELVRLAAHFEEFDRLLAKDGPVGRPLEFLLQELGREVNTTGSKSQSPDIARRIVELKTELERLREQVQNVE
jgi:uncharacterized protein (TIGR00255 family)